MLKSLYLCNKVLSLSLSLSLSPDEVQEGVQGVRVHFLGSLIRVVVMGGFVLARLAWLDDDDQADAQDDGYEGGAQVVDRSTKTHILRHLQHRDVYHVSTEQPRHAAGVSRQY